MTSSATDHRPGLPTWARVTPRRREHIERVASLLAAWAAERNAAHAELRRWLRAAYLHDALKDAPAADLASLAGPAWPNRKIQHGPAAAQKAALEGETDGGVLDAVRFHSVGYAGWDDVGRMLYLADYLEPGRPFHDERRADWTGKVVSDPRTVLRDVARARIARSLAAGHTLLPHTVTFWNSLV